jgi:hypothetical protein
VDEEKTMTAELASSFDAEGIDYTDPSNKERFFSSEERNKKIKPFEDRESAPIGQPGAACKPNLFFGFFHDGTRNNYGESIKNKNHTHSNIARLYSCYPGYSVPGVIVDEPEWKYRMDQFKNYFRVYIPGVGTRERKARKTSLSARRWPTRANRALSGPCCRRSITCIAFSTRNR